MVKVFQKNIKLVLIFVILIVAIILFYTLFYSSNGLSRYGIRTVEQEKYKISSSDINKLIKLSDSQVGVKKTKILYEGKMIRIIVEFNSDISITDIQKVFTTITENIPVKYKGYYDISFFSIKSDGKTETYPVLGYKNAYEDIIIWESNE